MKIQLNSKFIYRLTWLIFLLPNIIVLSSIFIFNKKYDNILGPILVVSLFTLTFLYFHLTHYSIKVVGNYLVIKNMFFGVRKIDINENEIKLNTVRKDLFCITLDLIIDRKKYRFITWLSKNEKTILNILRR